MYSVLDMCILKENTHEYRIDFACCPLVQINICIIVNIRVDYLLIYTIQLHLHINLQFQTFR